MHKIYKTIARALPPLALLGVLWACLTPPACLCRRNGQRMRRHTDAGGQREGGVKRSCAFGELCLCLCRCRCLCLCLCEPVTRSPPGCRLCCCQDALKEQKRTLERYVSDMTALNQRITKFLDENEAKSVDDPDPLVTPPDRLSTQLLEVVAEVRAVRRRPWSLCVTPPLAPRPPPPQTAACEDALYHADRVLENGTVSLEVFLKEIRNLARDQFLAKALARRICMSLQRAHGS